VWAGVAAHVARMVASIDGTGVAPLGAEMRAASTASSQSAPADWAAACASRWAGTSRPSREKSSCWLSAAWSPVDEAGPSPSGKPRRDSGSDGLREPGRCVTVRHVKAEVPDFR
jgi:hypothetical protein